MLCLKYCKVCTIVMIMLTVRSFNEFDRNFSESLTQGNFTMYEVLVKAHEEKKTSGARFDCMRIRSRHWFCPIRNQVAQAQGSCANGRVMIEERHLRYFLILFGIISKICVFPSRRLLIFAVPIFKLPFLLVSLLRIGTTIQDLLDQRLRR